MRGLTRAFIYYERVMDCRSAGNDEIEHHAATRFPFCAEPERLSPSRPRLFGAAEFRPGAPGRRPLPAAHRGYRRHALPAANSRPRSTRISPGSASPGRQPVRRQSEHLADYRAAVEKLVGAGPDLSGFREPRGDRASGRRARGGRTHGRAIPTARRFIRATRKSLSPDERERLIGAGRALCAAARHGGGDGARAENLAWTSMARGPAASTGAVTRAAGGLGRRHPGAQGDADQLSSFGRDRRRPAGRHRRGAGAGPVLVDQRAPPAAATCSDLPQPAYRHHRLVQDAAGHKLAKSSVAPACANCARRRDAGGYSPPGRTAVVLRW